MASVKGATILESMIATTVIVTAISLGTITIMNVLSTSPGLSEVAAEISIHNDSLDKEEELNSEKTALLGVIKDDVVIAINDSKEVNSYTIRWSDE